MENKLKSFVKLKSIIDASENKEISWSQTNSKVNTEIVDCLEELIDSKIKFVGMPSFLISENGEIVNVDDPNAIFMNVATRRISEVDQFAFIKSYPYIYIHKLRIANGTLEIVLAECNLSKKKVTFTISQKIMERFDSVADKLAINKSKFVENKMKELIESVKL